METLLAKALESKLKYYLRSYSRDQFKLQGRTVQLCNLDLNGDVLHSIIGLPSTLRVDTAHVERLEIRLPPLASVMTEPTVVYLSTLDLVLKETNPDEPVLNSNRGPAPPKSTSYGFADKVADGMTVEVGVVNLSLEPRGGQHVSGHDAAIWRPPIASITLRNLRLHTTNELWETVNLMETRSFYANQKCIFIFRKLVWESMSVDLIPHPAVFEEICENPHMARSRDGAKRALLGGERFLEDISGVAFITMHRTELNNPLGLEVNLKLSEAVCPNISEPGLRGLLRLLTGLYACLMRPDITPMTRMDPEVAGRSLITVEIERILIQVSDEEFQLELLLESLRYVQGSKAEDGTPTVDNMIRLHVGKVVLSDLLPDPPVALVQPRLDWMYEDDEEALPYFVNDHQWPRIYPICPLRRPPPSMLRFYAAYTLPPPKPTDKKNIASNIRILCRPIEVELKEESCFRIASLVSDGLMVKQQRENDEPPSNSLHNFFFLLDDFTLTVPFKDTSLERAGPPLPQPDRAARAGEDGASKRSEDARFLGARLHLLGFSAVVDCAQPFELLDVESEAACFALWPGQPVDASQLRIFVWADVLRVSLDVLHPAPAAAGSTTALRGYASGAEPVQLECMELKDPRIEIAMVTHDGMPLVYLPPPGGILRLAVACQELLMRTSQLQLLFILRMYGYLSAILTALLRVGEGKSERPLYPAANGAPSDAAPELNDGSPGVPATKAADLLTSSVQASLAELALMAPGDTALHLRVDNFDFKLLDSASALPLAPPSPAVPVSEAAGRRLSTTSLGRRRSSASGGSAAADALEADVLAQLFGAGMRLHAAHQSLGGAAAISWGVVWDAIRVECVETDAAADADDDNLSSPGGVANEPKDLEPEGVLDADSEWGLGARGNSGHVVEPQEDVLQLAAAATAQLQVSDSAPELGSTGEWKALDERLDSGRGAAAGRPTAPAADEEAEGAPMRVVFWSGDKDKMMAATSMHQGAPGQRGSSFGSISDGGGLAPSSMLVRSDTGTSIQSSGSANSLGAVASSAVSLAAQEEREWSGAGSRGPGGLEGPMPGPIPFIAVSVRHIIPYDLTDLEADHALSVEAKVGGVRMSGGWHYNESLLQRFGVLGLDGGPGQELMALVQVLEENGVLQAIVSALMQQQQEQQGPDQQEDDQGLTPVALDPEPPVPKPANGAAAADAGSGLSAALVPRDVRVDVQLLDWLFALEGSTVLPLGGDESVFLDELVAAVGQRLAKLQRPEEGGRGPLPALRMPRPQHLTARQRWRLREEMSWHSSFRLLRIVSQTKHRPKGSSSGGGGGGDGSTIQGSSLMPGQVADRLQSQSGASLASARPAPVDPAHNVTVQIEGLQAFKPRQLEDAAAAAGLIPADLALQLSGAAGMPGSLRMPSAPQSPAVLPAAPPAQRSAAAPDDFFRGSPQGARSSPAQPASPFAVSLGLGRIAQPFSMGFGGASAPAMPGSGDDSLAQHHSRALPPPRHPGASASSAGAGVDVAVHLEFRDPTSEAADAQRLQAVGQEQEDGEAGRTKLSEEQWAVKSVQFSVREPIVVEASKLELEHMLQVSKMELAAAARVAVGMLKLLQLKAGGLVSQSIIDQLVHLGERMVAGDSDSLAAVASEAFLTTSSWEAPPPAPFAQLAPATEAPAPSWHALEAELEAMEAKVQALLAQDVAKASKPDVLADSGEQEDGDRGGEEGPGADQRHSPAMNGEAAETAKPEMEHRERSQKLLASLAEVRRALQSVAGLSQQP